MRFNLAWFVFFRLFFVSPLGEVENLEFPNGTIAVVAEMLGTVWVLCKRSPKPFLFLSPSLILFRDDVIENDHSWLVELLTDGGLCQRVSLVVVHFDVGLGNRDDVS